MATTKELYETYKEKMNRVADIKYASAVLQWDQETYLPPKSAAMRGQQIATLSELAHELFTDGKLGDTLGELSQRSDLSEDEKRNTELTLEDYNKNKKYTSAFVRKMSEQVNKTFHSWIEARKENSFSRFEKDLSSLIQLKKEETEILGYVNHPYNSLLNEYEKGCTVELLDKTFSDLLPELKKLLDTISAKPQVDDSFLLQHYPKQQQWDWGMHLIRELHFDFEAGRQDLSEHPFTTNFSSTDVRITTRVNENDLASMTWSCIHETGHALYEQGLPPDQYGLPLGEAASLSMHESQSRLWENNVGRSLSFWKYYFPQLQQYFPKQLGDISIEDFYKGINKVETSFIRTEADELTYHFHVFIRYQLEKNLIDGSIQTKDIPAFWNENYKKYLNVTVPNDKQGCLQDIHWSHGSFGYFPTYSLGSFYAAQFFACARNQAGDLDQQLENGNSHSLLAWLRKNVHGYGRKFTSEELCKNITGKTLDTKDFMTYMLQKYTMIYNL
ncbi:MAG: carboxypeptidase [Chitinophagaceae bacterium]|nr:carboxypeptidase [Chitinophagaceae bacterium]